MTETTPLMTYALRLADTCNVLSHRLSEWCGHAPIIEEDLALANIGLDLIGQARHLYTYAAELEGKGRDEDDLAYLRVEREYANYLLVEQPNRDFAFTIMRQFLFSVWHNRLYKALMQSSDETLASIAARSVKETEYHVRHAAEWVIRLGDGTEESHCRIAEALEDLWMYTGEMFEMDTVDLAGLEAGWGVNCAAMREAWLAEIEPVLAEATLTRPADGYMQTGGRTGIHTEHLGHMLASMQYLQRAYPGMSW